MPVRFNHLADDRRTFTMPVGSDTLTITYRPSAITTVTEDRVSELVKDQRQGAGLIALLTTAIVEWDLLGEDDRPLPLTEAALRPLPIKFLNDIAVAMGNDLRPNPPKGATSAAG